ncbi:hypothetical protein GMRT_14371 [Giardia muris]|uniref:Uncharacterized protein n=1 Tax=Giardia muris TaxID=5742 RepID=A0A4Z1T6Q2_GIAMU|nr:hypothetical protein GMRT_14371 [Giardia muris]|eukprot:TNJ28219.1 hypothetical protein GMRT_14371 [Giardia muris]
MNSPKDGQGTWMPTDDELSKAARSNGSGGSTLCTETFQFDEKYKDLPSYTLSSVKLRSINQFERNRQITGIESTYNFDSYTIALQKPGPMKRPSGTSKYDGVGVSQIADIRQHEMRIPNYKPGTYVPRAVREKLQAEEKSRQTSISSSPIKQEQQEQEQAQESREETEGVEVVGMAVPSSEPQSAPPPINQQSSNYFTTAESHLDLTSLRRQPGVNPEAKPKAAGGAYMISPGKYAFVSRKETAKYAFGNE